MHFLFFWPSYSFPCDTVFFYLLYLFLVFVLVLYYCLCFVLCWLLFFDLFLFNFLIFFVSVESSLLSFGVYSHCLSSSMSSFLFMYFISCFKCLSSTFLVELSLFFLCSFSLLLLSGFSVSLSKSLDFLIGGLYISALHPLYMLISVIASCASSIVEKHIAWFLVLFEWNLSFKLFTSPYSSIIPLFSSLILHCSLFVTNNFSCYIFVFYVLFDPHSITDLWSLIFVLCSLLLLCPFLLMLYY